jgi:hypothetical protein
MLDDQQISTMRFWGTVSYFPTNPNKWQFSIENDFSNPVLDVPFQILRGIDGHTTILLIEG